MMGAGRSNEGFYRTSNRVYVICYTPAIDVSMQSHSSLTPVRQTVSSIDFRTFERFHEPIRISDTPPAFCRIMHATFNVYEFDSVVARRTVLSFLTMTRGYRSQDHPCAIHI